MIKYMNSQKKTATASEDFKNNLLNGIRYIDKTRVLIPLLDGTHETTFFLRPRRFGKTLTLSMIRYFIEDTRNEELNAENRSLFEGLRIMDAGEKYLSQMTSYPVIHLTLQSVGGKSFSEASYRLCFLIQSLYNDHVYLLESPNLSEEDKRYFRRIYTGRDIKNQDKISVDEYVFSLKKLSEFLKKDSGRRTVVLIDEYDVPLDKAYQNGYYQEMVGMIGPILQSVLKTNSENLRFAVVTGCLRIAKEGIYTGLNNPGINTVLSDDESDAIGFTDAEVKDLLTDSGFPDHYDEVKNWYDGYFFGKTKIYNPWSVIKHIETLTYNPERGPRAYWAGTSGNAIIREMAKHADEDARLKIEKLLQGGEIMFPVRENIVYDELYKDSDNVFNVLLSSGYLTANQFDGINIWARIPNKEVHHIYEEQISGWFRESLSFFDIQALYSAMEKGNVKEIEKILTNEFLSAMSYYDTVEAFYHGILLALMQLNKAFLCVSNRESGDGRFDIQSKRKFAWDLAFVLEVKISERAEEMLTDAQKGANQTGSRAYMTELQREGYEKIMTYGLSFFQKRCRVVQGKTYIQ